MRAPCQRALSARSSVTILLCLPAFEWAGLLACHLTLVHHARLQALSPEQLPHDSTHYSRTGFSSSLLRFGLLRHKLKHGIVLSVPISAGSSAMDVSAGSLFEFLKANETMEQGQECSSFPLLGVAL